MAASIARKALTGFTSDEVTFDGGLVLGGVAVRMATSKTAVLRRNPVRIRGGRATVTGEQPHVPPPAGGKAGTCGDPGARTLRPP
ncbi:hypothetical protein A8926_7712 [Saccharopolyspora spinosa]|uniref:Uncharacterized protein n=1 Tax=Saccharopolyspora spinosa TaxID=60894 RepID=A0A2N3Y9E1_SACSN|nr:hypothetical protein A8926_7712 [Saccharopolyspora spinosa]